VGALHGAGGHDRLEGIRNRLALPALRVRFDVHQGTAAFEGFTPRSPRFRWTREAVHRCGGNSHSGYGRHSLSIFSEGRCFRFRERSGDCAVSLRRDRRQFLDAVTAAMITPGPIVRIHRVFGGGTDWIIAGRTRCLFLRI